MKPQITIIGAGAAGLFCAGLLGQKGYSVTVIDNGKKVGRKILMSGGGKCNFTNLHIDANCYLSENQHFCKSALKRFTQWDFIQLVKQYNIAYHEKSDGQLFCDNSANDIVDMLVSECHKGKVQFLMQTQFNDVDLEADRIRLITSKGIIETDKLIIATGGLSMPALGMTSVAYKLADKYHIPVVPLKAGLVPFTLHKPLLDHLSVLAGVSLPVEVTTNNVSFKGDMLFTHRGLSGPSILQISSYWQVGTPVVINLIPNQDLNQILQNNSSLTLKNGLAHILPKRLIDVFIQLNLIVDKPIKQLIEKEKQSLYQTLSAWTIIPNGTEGYRTAEVTLGGISTQLLSSKTMAVKSIPNLYFIGEVIDVSGWLGGFNFQWAWSSAYACASEIND